MARHPQELGPLTADSRWQKLAGDGAALWTDDFSNILTVLTWESFDLKVAVPDLFTGGAPDPKAVNRQDVENH